MQSGSLERFVATCYYPNSNHGGVIMRAIILPAESTSLGRMIG